MCFILKLATRYDDEGLTNLLRAESSSRHTRSIVAQLREVQTKNWLRNGNAADDVFNFLNLNQEGVQFLKSPVLSTWVSYVTKLEQNPYQSLLGILAKRYDDEGLAKLLSAAMKNSSMSTIT